MAITIRLSLNVLSIACIVGCGTSVPTGPAPVGGYDYTPVKYEIKAVNLPKSEIDVDDATIVEGSSSVLLKSPVKCSSAELLTFRGKVVGLTETDAPQVIAVECTRQMPQGLVITSAGVINCKFQDGTVDYSVDLPSPTIAGKHKLTIKAVRLRKADGSIVGEGGATTSILAEGTVEVSGDAPDLPTMVPAPDPAFSRGSTKPTK